MTVLAIGLNTNQIIKGCFGTLLKLAEKHTINICITSNENFDKFNVYKININASTQDIISNLELLIKRVNPTIVFIPPDKRLRDISLVASRYVSNVIIYSIKKSANMIVDINGTYDIKTKLLKTKKVEDKEMFKIYKMVLLDKWF
ncbi:MAG: hypothetical protein QW416_04040 [Candidatus Nitrosocaldaceae archaeon]